MGSYEYLSYDPIALADEIAKLDVAIAGRVRELKQQRQEEVSDDKADWSVATDIHQSDHRF